jgi:hypothetical protein
MEIAERYFSLTFEGIRSSDDSCSRGVGIVEQIGYAWQGTTLFRAACRPLSSGVILYLLAMLSDLDLHGKGQEERINRKKKPLGGTGRPPPC